MIWQEKCWKVINNEGNVTNSIRMDMEGISKNETMWRSKTWYENAQNIIALIKNSFKVDL